MVRLIFTLKKSFFKPFGFKKKVYGSVQYFGFIFHEKNFDKMKTTKF